jgi:two-component system capsular synthesis response regulator RcsB
MLNIIIADDHPVVRIGARATIENSGVGVVAAEATTVDELLDILATRDCDVLVTDLSMPGLRHADGYAMVERICRNHPDLPVLVLSMSCNVNILRMVMATGVRGLLDKAASMAELPIAIQSVHKGGTYISSSLRRLTSEAGAQRMLGFGAKPLSPREVEVLRLLARGLRVKEIALKLNRGITTISKQKSDALRKLGIRNDAELFDFLSREGFAG